MAKYYLIEKYEAEVELQRNDFCTEKRTTVSEYNSLEKLEAAILEGPRNGGKIIAAKGLEIKLSISLEGRVLKKLGGPLDEEE